MDYRQIVIKRSLLIVSSPLDSKKEQSKPSDGENAADIVDPSQDLFSGEPLRVYTRRRPVEDAQQQKCASINDDRDPSSPSPSCRRSI
jgi:hypothetical protein